MRRMIPSVPSRVEMVLRSPTRDQQQHQQQAPTGRAVAAAAGVPAVVQKTPLPVVYVRRPPACLYSEELVALCEECCIDVDIFDIDENGAPAWLPGTPSIELITKEVFCGDAAFFWVLAQPKPSSVAATAAAAAAQQEDAALGDGFSFPPANRSIKCHRGGTDAAAAAQGGSAPQTEEAATAAAYSFLTNNSTTEQPAAKNAGVTLDSLYSEGAKIAAIANAAAAEPILNVEQQLAAKMNQR